MLSTFMVGCGSKESSENVVSSSSELKEVKLKMYLIGDKPKDFDAVYEKVNEKMKEKIKKPDHEQISVWRPLLS